MPVGAADTTEALHDKLAALGGRLIVEALEMAAGSGLQPRPQPSDGISYAHKIEKHEAQINWLQSAVAIDRRIRAFNPFPVAFSHLGQEAIKFREAAVLAQAGPVHAVAGQVLAVSAEGVDINTGDGVLRATRLQRAGGKALAAADFLRGFEVTPGMVFNAGMA